MGSKVSSLRAVFGDSDRVAAFVGNYGTRVDFGECQAIGFNGPDGKLEAGVVYHDWWPEKAAIEVSAASRSKLWLTKERVRLIFDYPVEQIGCDLVYAKTDEPIIGRMFKALGGDGYVIPGLWTVCTLTAGQWRAFRDERLFRV